MLFCSCVVLTMLVLFHWSCCIQKMLILLFPESSQSQQGALFASHGERLVQKLDHTQIKLPKTKQKKKQRAGPSNGPHSAILNTPPPHLCGHCHFQTHALLYKHPHPTHAHPCADRHKHDKKPPDTGLKHRPTNARIINALFDYCSHTHLQTRTLLFALRDTALFQVD